MVECPDHVLTADIIARQYEFQHVAGIEAVSNINKETIVGMFTNVAGEDSIRNLTCVLISMSQIGELPVMKGQGTT